MTWSEVEGATGSHFVSVASFAKPARERLPQIELDDVDELFSLRHGGRQRIWGVREMAILKVVWWDPEHAVCPSAKKHT